MCLRFSSLSGGKVGVLWKTWIGSLMEEPSSTRRSWRVEVYLTRAGSEESNLQRSEPQAQARGAAYTIVTCGISGCTASRAKEEPGGVRGGGLGVFSADLDGCAEYFLIREKPQGRRLSVSFLGCFPLQAASWCSCRSQPTGGAWNEALRWNQQS